jgi:hypothetical protein
MVLYNDVISASSLLLLFLSFNHDYAVLPLRSYFGYFFIALHYVYLFTLHICLLWSFRFVKVTHILCVRDMNLFICLFMPPLRTPCIKSQFYTCFCVYHILGYFFKIYLIRWIICIRLIYSFIRLMSRIFVLWALPCFSFFIL